MNWKSLYNDLISVFKRHFMPPIPTQAIPVPKPEADIPAVRLVKMIAGLQRQQQELNNLRASITSSAGLFKDDEVLRELSRLAAMAPNDEAFDKHDYDGYDDFMFG